MKDIVIDTEYELERLAKLQEKQRRKEKAIERRNTKRSNRHIWANLEGETE